MMMNEFTRNSLVFTCTIWEVANTLMGYLGVTQNIFFKWGYWYEQTEMDWHKIPEFLWSQAKWVALCEPVLFLENPCIKARSYLTNQNNVSTQITIIKWHDIVVEIEICGWICPGWVDLQASTERKGTNLEQVWC